MAGTHEKILKRIEKKKKKTDADTMYGNTSLTVTQKACVPHYRLLLQLTTGTMSRVNHMTHQRSNGNVSVIVV